MSLEPYLIVLIATPLAASITSYLAGDRMARFVSLVSSIILLLSSMLLDARITGSPIAELNKYVVFKEFILDPIAAWILTALSTIYFLVSLYSIGFTGKEIALGKMSRGKARLLHSLMNIFILTMVLSVVSNNIFIMWVSVEATTLSSVFLVSLYGEATSLEAAWKYAVICSLGLVFGLYGTSLLYAEASKSLGASAMLWSSLVSHGSAIAPKILVMSLALLIIGYGTKAGLVPMWTWLPDAHAEAPAPVSSLLSGVLVNCAFVSIVRYIALTLRLGLTVIPQLLLCLGIASMWLAAFFIIVSRDLKRLLAFSTVENIGISAVGIGLANPISIMGGLYHILAHGLVKSMLFMTSGAAYWIYKTRDMRFMGTLVKYSRVLGIALVIGGLAIGCSPPFAMFVSYFKILYGGVRAGSLVAVALYIAASIIVFGGMMSHLLRVALGKPKSSIVRNKTGGDTGIPGTCAVALVVSLVIITLLGLYIPKHLYVLLKYASMEVMGFG